MHWLRKQFSIAAVSAAIVMLPVAAQNLDSAQSIERLLDQVASELKSGSEAATPTFSRLQALELIFTAAQRAHYLKLLSAYYGLRGMHLKEVEAGEQALKNIVDPDERASVLY